MKLLIVSDNSSEIEITRECATRMRLDSLAAKSASEGRRKFLRTDAQAVVVDLEMPGAENLIANLVEEQTKPQIVVVCSVQHQHRAMRTWNRRAAEYLIKPLQPLALEIALHRVHEIFRLLRWENSFSRNGSWRSPR